jgi:hypothetical protein
MEVDIADANDLNQCYVSNLQERIIAQEASLTKSEKDMLQIHSFT